MIKFQNSINVKQSDELIKSLSQFTMTQKESKIVSLGHILFNPKKQISVFMKIFLNYSQMVAIIQSFDLKWPFAIKSLFNVYSNAGGVSANVVSVDCLVQDANIKTEPIYIQTFVFNLVPVFVFLIALLILTVVHYTKKKSQKIRFVVVIIVTCIFLQPPIVKLLFDNLICKNIDGHPFLQEKLILNCDEESYKQW